MVGAVCTYNLAGATHFVRIRTDTNSTGAPSSFPLLVYLCAEVCCCVLQCVVACGSIPQRVAACCSVLKCATVCHIVHQCVAAKPQYSSYNNSCALDALHPVSSSFSFLFFCCYACELLHARLPLDHPHPTAQQTPPTHSGAPEMARTLT